MQRRLLVVATVAISFASASADLTACGDKFLRAGRSVRMRNYAAEFPAAILIYTSSTTNAKGLKEWQKTLAQAGHSSRVVASSQAFAQAAAEGKYDVVMADYAAAARLRSTSQSMSFTPAFLPIVHTTAKKIPAEVKKEFEHLIHEDMDSFDALAEIDHLMELRLKASPTAK